MGGELHWRLEGTDRRGRREVGSASTYGGAVTSACFLLVRCLEQMLGRSEFSNVSLEDESTSPLGNPSLLFQGSPSIFLGEAEA